jgi:peptidoglycan hydrolase-like protein with peptidoglycan-binding domain
VVHGGPAYGQAGGAATASVQRKPDPKKDKPTLRKWEVPEELQKLERLHIDETSIRVVQKALDGPVTGRFNDADVMAVSKLRVDHGLSRYAEVTDGTLDLLIRQGIKLGMEDSLIYLIADYYKLDTRQETLSIRFSATMVIPATTNFDPAGMRMILIGSKAFTGAQALRRAIQGQLTAPVPATTATGPAPGPVPSILTQANADMAAGFNGGVLSDPRSVRAVQRTVSGAVTGVFDATTSQRIANLQQGRGLSPVDGSINEDTFHALITSLSNGLAEESAVRMIVDYQKISENGVTSATVDPTKTAGDPYEVSWPGDGSASAITFAAHAFFQPPARIVHTVVRAFEEVQLRHAGETGEPLMFKLEHLVTTSPGMADETYVPFMADAVQALFRYKNLAPKRQALVWTQFEEIRNKVVARGQTAAPNDHDLFREVEDEYVAMPRPK